MADSNNSVGRVIAHVVDIQQSIILHFDNLSKAVESLKQEHSTSIADLRKDLRRTDDRSLKQVDELKDAHNKEVERLLNIIQTLLTKEAVPATPVAPAMPTPQQQHAMLAQQQLQASIIMQNQNMYQRHMQEEFAKLAMQSATANQANFVGTPVLPPQIKPSITAGVLPQVPKINPPVVTAVVPPPIVPVQNKEFVVPPPPIVKPPVVEEKPKTVVIPPATTPAPASTSVKPFGQTSAAPTTFSFGGPSGIFGSKSVTPAAPTTKTPTKTAEKEEDEDVVEDYEPEGDFKPVIPLPELVDVKTGEEEESVVFNERSRLYIYSEETSEWKERGTGQLKVLLNKETKKYRVVMRRDQVLKVCANFPIVGDLVIQKMASNEKAYSWFCEDFSEEAPEHVKLSARFSTVEIALEFKKLFEKAVAEHKSSTPQKEVTIKSEVESVKKEAPVKKEESKEVLIPSNKENVGFGDKFKPAPGSWVCDGCYVENKPGTDACECCGSGKDGKPADRAAAVFSKPSIIPPATGTPKFSFGMSAAAAAKEPITQTQSPQFGGSLNGSANTSSIFGGAGTPKSSLFGSGAPKDGAASSTTPTFSFGKPAAAPASSTPKFSFAKAAEQAATSSPATTSLFGNSVKPAEPAPSFSFGKPAAEPAKNPPKFSFSKQEPVAFVKASNEAASSPATTSTSKPTVFGGFSGGETFSSFAAKQGTNIFEGETAKKAQEEFKAQKKNTSIANNSNVNTNDEHDETNDEGADEEEPDIEFTPLIPLPDLIEVKTGEEDEEVLFKARSKLYKFNKDLGENKERGVGEFKILYNKTTNQYRCVMRREQVHKICANFRIEKTITVSTKGGMPNVLTFVCNDYSEEPAGEVSVFILKFKEEQTANDFKTVFAEAQTKLT